jgi:uncharacterized protein YbbC (DUF1343 family)
MTDRVAAIELGVNRLLESEPDILDDVRIGLIANSASVDRSGTPTVILLKNAGMRLTCLFAPEHGYDVSFAAGDTVSDVFDGDAGLPVRSLYGRTRQPTEQMLHDVDALVFDLQDVGVRCYTYIWTMALAMQAAALFGKLFVVLDRPNPIGGVAVQGPILDPQFESFMGMYPIPLRHGMTVGELAMMFNRHFAIGADLAVIRMKGWRRRLCFAETGLQWIPPSPAIPTAECALPYAGTCLFEGTNISEGRGTSSPFRLIGAPWLSPLVLGDMDEKWLAGFALSPQKFTPGDSKHAGKECAGLFIGTVNPDEADPIALAVVLLTAIAARHENRLKWDEKHFDTLAGTSILRAEIRTAALESSSARTRRLEQLFAKWGHQHREFEKLRLQYLLYEG